MKKEYDFFIAGRARNKDNILEICDVFDKLNISYYCFWKNDQSYIGKFKFQVKFN